MDNPFNKALYKITNLLEYLDNITLSTLNFSGNFSDKDLNQKRNFYIAFTSNTLSEKMMRMYSKDQLYASLWNPTKKTAVGEELKYKPES